MHTINPPKTLLKPSLPQNDTSTKQAARQKALKEIQAKYILSTDNVLGLPLLKNLPNEEQFDNKYNTGRSLAEAPIGSNDLKVRPNLNDFFGPFLGLADYESLFVDVPVPNVAQNWLSDESFGEQRLSGVNPVMIARVVDIKKCLENFDLSQLKDALGGSVDIDELIKSNKLYLADLTPYLDGVPEGSIFTPAGPKQKYLPKPSGLFYWHEDGAELKDPALKPGRLLPLAIQVELEDSEVKIFTPDSPGLLWDIAKMCFSIADANIHEMSTHLGRCHFAQEAFGAITPSQLAPEHPLYILLKPHLRFLVCNNLDGMNRLVQRTDDGSGPVDFLLASTLDGSLAMSIKAAKSWSVTETFPESIQNRHIDPDNSLPHYPYRDDGILIWDAIHAYVEEYVGLYYKDAQDIRQDTELQAWAKKLADTGSEGGNIKDMPSTIDSIEQLIKILSVIIFQNSAGHSSVNYPQYDYIGFSPNMPLAGYRNHREFLAKKNTSPEEQLTFLLNFAPPQFSALSQIAITNTLSVYHYDSLGDYSKELVHPMARHALYRFIQSLAFIEKRIEKRNRLRSVPYKYLLPSEILNSASI